MRHLVFLLFFCSANFAYSQTTIELTEVLVKTRIATLELSTGQGEQDELSQSYQKVLRTIQQARDHEHSAADYSRELISAPEKERVILERLETLPVPETRQADSEWYDLLADELEVSLARARAELATLLASRGNLDRRLSSQEATEGQIRSRNNEISNLLREIPTQQLYINADASPSATEAVIWLRAATRLALNWEQRALEARLVSLPVRYSSYRAERAEVLRTIRLKEVDIELLEDIVELSRLQQSEDVRKELESLQSDSTILALTARANVELGDQLRVYSTEIAGVNDCRSRIRKLKVRLTERYASGRRRVEFASESVALGQILLVQLTDTVTDLEDIGSCDIPSKIGDLVIDRIAYEERLLKIGSVSAYITTLSREFPDAPKLTEAEQEQASEFVRTQRKLLTDVVALQTSYIDLIGNLEIRQTELQELGKEYQTFLTAYLLWVRSNPAVTLETLQAVPGEIADLAAALEDTRALLKPNVVGTLFTFLALIALFLSTKNISAWAISQNDRVGRPRDDSISITFAALFALGLLSMRWPLVILLLFELIGSSDSTLAAVLQSTLPAIAVMLFLMLFLKEACRQNGFASTHFNWRGDTCSLVHQEISWLIKSWLPLAAISTALYHFGDYAMEASLFRLSFFIIAVLTAWRVVRIDWQRGSQSPEGIHTLQKQGVRLRVMTLVLVALSLLICAAGYLHSAAMLVRGTMSTIWIIVGLLFLYEVFCRWSLVIKRRVRFRELVASLTSGPEQDNADEDRMALHDLSEATTKLLRTSIMLLGVFLLWYVWAPVFPVLSVLEQIVIWTSSSNNGGVTVSTDFSLTTLMGVVLFVGFIVLMARNVPALLELVLLQYESVSAGSRYTIITLTSYCIIGGGTIAIFSLLGFNWSELQWLVAALGVGIGFGLQEIVANFISGLIILFERPIRVGDIVTIGETDGTVTKIRIRATTLRDWNGKELVVPNKEFVTGRLLNWSLSDSNTRILITVGIAYGSDLEKALTLLETIVCSNEHVLKEPPPSIIMSEFGDNSLELIGRCFVGDAAFRLDAKSEIYRAIYRQFADVGIPIAFPQRDVHLDAAEPIRITLES